MTLIYDLISIGGGGGATLTQITASDTFTFTAESDGVVKTITNASLTNANIKSFSYIPTETAGASLDDFKLNGVTFNIENIIDNTSFDIRATSINNATGTYTITYSILY